jgi:hypothetical protein
VMAKSTGQDGMVSSELCADDGMSRARSCVITWAPNNIE